ncbi:transglutaminaseTgpA domain-containing protein [Agromyces marinus]|uniref:transglutaminaseTgpA domain-containing protein n=1 Tax=Agromyces marinus TaxID=1389020 RepID=UPI002572F06F|nr:transglutaminaseTgpA domain-containing protein [Agromyces marinus]
MPDRLPLSRAQSLALSAVSLLLVLVATTALGPLISGSAWWWAGAVVAVAVIGGGAALRSIRTPPSLVPPLELVAALLALTLLFGGGTALAFIVPTPDTLAAFGALAEGPSARSSSSRFPRCRFRRWCSRSRWASDSSPR